MKPLASLRGWEALLKSSRPCLPHTVFFGRQIWTSCAHAEPPCKALIWPFNLSLAILRAQAVLAQPEAPPAEEALAEGVAAVLVEAAANAAEARSPAAAGPNHAVAPPAGNSKVPSTLSPVLRSQLT